MMRAAARSWKTIALRSALSFWKRCAQGAEESADEVSEGEAATMKADTVVNNIESNEKAKTAGMRKARRAELHHRTARLDNMLARLDAEDAREELEEEDPTKQASDISKKIRELRDRRTRARTSLSRSPSMASEASHSNGTSPETSEQQKLSKEDVTVQAKARVAKLVDEAKAAAEKKFCDKIDRQDDTRD